MRSKLLIVLLVAAVMMAACAPAATPAAPTAAPQKAAEPTKAPAAAPTATKAPEPTKAPAPTAAPAATKAPEPTKATEPTKAAAPAAAGVKLPAVDPLKVTGNIITAGSSTVFPLSERMAEQFKDEGYKGNITIDSIGTGAGLERFCKTGETDVANASRAIKASEKESCQKIGREPVEFRVGTDALAVVVGKNNTFLKDVTLEQLAKIFSTQAEKWSDVDPAWPKENILRFSPGTDSGTFDYFIEAVMTPAYKTADAGKKEILGAKNLQLSEDDNILVKGVLGSPYAIGYFGYAYYLENKDKLTALAVKGVAPSDETAENGKYPLARPLFIYSTAKIMKDKPQVGSFINFYLTHVNEEIKTVGYFPASAAALDTARQNWLNAMK